MNSLLRRHEVDTLSGLSSLQFRQTNNKIDNEYSSLEKRHIKYNNQIAYITNKAGTYRCCDAHHIAIITLSAVKDVHWKLDNNFGERFDAPAGTVLLLPQGTDYNVTWPIDADAIQITLDEASLSGLQDITGSLTLDELFPHPTRLANPKILLIANLLRAELLKNAPISDGYVKALIAVTMVQLVQNHSFLSSSTKQNQHGGLSYHASRRIEAYLRENYMRKLSIEKMADILGVSGGHFLTSFRVSFGQTPHQYLMMLRLNAVEELLIESDIALAEIAHRTGFSSQSHMTTALKKIRMTTPGELRRRRPENSISI